MKTLDIVPEFHLGLGLAVCFSIAARHNARIDIRTGKSGREKFFIISGKSFEI